MASITRIGDPKIVTADGIVVTEEQVRAAKSVTDRQRLLVGNQQDSDFVFLVGQNDASAVRIPVHSLLLRLASDTFSAMFSGKWKEEKVIRIKDCDPSAMFSVIRWIYCNELVYEKGKLPDVIAIANKYFVKSLIDFVVSDDGKAFPDPWDLITIGVGSGNKRLKEKGAQMIAADIRHQMDSAGFMEASAAVIAVLLSLPLKYEEMDLFRKCVKWAEKSCRRQGLAATAENQRKVMDPFIHLIAFSGMSAEEFADLSFKSDILTDKEKVHIFQSFFRTGKFETGFPKNRRSGYPCLSWKANEYIMFRQCMQCGKKICDDCYTRQCDDSRCRGCDCNAKWKKIGRKLWTTCSGVRFNGRADSDDGSGDYDTRDHVL